MLPLRLLVSLCSLTWALSLFLPGQSFDEAPYTIMAAAASENIWATLFLIAGILGWVSVCKEIDNMSTLFIDSFVCILWTTSITSVFYAYWISPELNPFFPPTHMASDFWIAMTAWWILLRELADEVERKNDARGN